MSSDANIKTIMGVYEAFGRGDVTAILDAVTDDVDWAAEAAGTAAPWSGVRHGKDAVAAFFAEFGSTMEVEEFTPVSIAASDTDVLTVVRFRARSRARKDRGDGPAPRVHVPGRQDRLLPRHRGHRPDPGRAPGLTRQPRCTSSAPRWRGAASRRGRPGSDGVAGGFGVVAAPGRGGPAECPVGKLVHLLPEVLLEPMVMTALRARIA